MKKELKLIAAALAAITALSCTSATAYADKLKTVGGVTYKYSDSGEQKGKYTGWAKTSKGRYYYKDGVKLKSKWLSVKGRKTYYLLSSGKMATGDIFFKNGKTYHFGSDGKLDFGIFAGINKTDEDEITQSSLRMQYDGFAVAIQDTPVWGISLDDDYGITNFRAEFVRFNTDDYIIEHKDGSGNWVECERTEHEKQVLSESADTAESFFRLSYERIVPGYGFTEINWADRYGKLPAGEYRYVNSYTCTPPDGSAQFTGKFRFTFTVREDRVFTAAELQAVYDRLNEHRKEYGIYELYISEDRNRVEAVVYDALSADELNAALREYIKTLDDDRILLIGYDDLGVDD